MIRREILITPGDIFNTVRVETSKKRLDNLGYFSKVETYPEDTGVPGRKDLTIQVEEKRTGALNFGAGFSTIDSLVGFAELTQGNFDLLNWPSFTGGGQNFALTPQFGNERKDFILALTEPCFLDRPLSLGGQAFYREARFSQLDLRPTQLRIRDRSAQAAQSPSCRSASIIGWRRSRYLMSTPAFLTQIRSQEGSESEKPDRYYAYLRHARQRVSHPPRTSRSRFRRTSPADFWAAMCRSLGSTWKARSIFICVRHHFAH